jgi:hypothetical protein
LAWVELLQTNPPLSTRNRQFLFEQLLLK